MNVVTLDYSIINAFALQNNHNFFGAEESEYSVEQLTNAVKHKVKTGKFSWDSSSNPVPCLTSAKVLPGYTSKTHTHACKHV